MWDWLLGLEDQKKKTPFIYQALHKQLENAILSGVLRAGEKLPPQRLIAAKLNIAVATVTRVYGIAEKQGLVTATVGKGSYVSTMPLLPQAISAQNNQCINLSIIKPQVSVVESQLKHHLSELSLQSGLTRLMDYNPGGGSLTDQQAAKTWLVQQGVTLTNKVINICSGAQHGLNVLLNCVSQYGDYIAVEKLCYPGIISAANQLGRKLVPIEMDSDGMCADSLDKACSQYDIKMVIVVASHQNPTSTVMSEHRREAIARVASLRSLWLVDDDVYGFLSPKQTVLSNFLPERSFYLTSFSKSILPGLRVGYLVSPNSFSQQIAGEIRNSIWMPVPLTVALASKLIFSGDANQIQNQQCEIAIKRQRLARSILEGYCYESQVNGYHLWLTLPQCWRSESFCLELKKRGVLVTNAEYFCVESRKNTNAVRISLMSPESNEELSFALNIIVKLIKSNPI